MWLKHSLFSKLLIGMLIAAVIPFSLSNLISYQTTSRSVEKQIIELNLKTMEIAMGNVKEYLQELNRVSVSFYHDQTLMKYLRSNEVLPTESIYITEQLATLYSKRPEFHAVRYVSALNRQGYTKFDGSQLGNLQLPELPVPTAEELWDKNNEFKPLSLDNKQFLAIHRLITDYPRTTVLGLVSLYAKMDEFSRLLRPLNERTTGEAVFLYIKSDMNLLYSTEGEQAAVTPAWAKGQSLSEQRGSVKGEWNGEKGVLVYVRDHYLEMPLTMIKFVPTEAINESANRTLSSSLMIQFAAIGFVVVLAALLAYVTIAPVKRLLRIVARVEAGQFDVGQTTVRQDELGVLESRFRMMIHNLDDLINREYRNRLELTTARLKMLQAQINPHFLYNTLQSIGTMALRHGSEEISGKIAELGSILRYSMDLKTETVTLQREIEHTQYYLSLQTGRFKNKLSYTLSCPDEALPMMVPKMILQPLVENSIIHGVEKGRGFGTLHIGIELHEQLCIRVMDNGKGIGPETIKRIQREYASRQLHTGEEGGIGLINVLHRLYLSYEHGFDWDIHSVPYEATVITLRIPVHHNQKE